MALSTKNLFCALARVAYDICIRCAKRTLIYLCTVLTYARVITNRRTWMTHERRASLGKNTIRSPLDVARLTVIWTTSTYSIRALDWTAEAWSPTIGTRVCAAIERARTITIQGSPGHRWHRSVQCYAPLVPFSSWISFHIEISRFVNQFNDNNEILPGSDFSYSVEINKNSTNFFVLSMLPFSSLSHFYVNFFDFLNLFVGIILWKHITLPFH